MTADLTGTTENAPYVFVVSYEFRELPLQDVLPETGDRGTGMWIALMAAASAAMAMLIAPPRRRKARR